MTIRDDPNSLLLRDLARRAARFRRNPDLEALLEELSRLLAPAEAEAEARFTAPALPPLLLVGNPRSGTSLFMQFLAATGGFAVPTNLLSRFYYAPYLGAKVQLLLTDPRFDYRGELTRAEGAPSLDSDLGKTRGSLSPSEFFHFWRRFLPNYDPEPLDADAEAKVDAAGLRRGVAAIEAVFGRPFAAKAIIVQYNLALLRRVFPTALLVHVVREPLYVMQSILRAREEFYGDRSVWWSVKPPEHAALKDLDVHRQIAGQVFHTDRALRAQLAAVPDDHKLTVDYAAFCRDPAAHHRLLVERYARLGHRLDGACDGVGPLAPRDTVRMAPEDRTAFEAAWDELVAAERAG